MAMVHVDCCVADIETEHQPADGRLPALLRSEVAVKVMAAPNLRGEAVAHARALLKGGRWSHPEEVAAVLVDSLVSRELP